VSILPISDFESVICDLGAEARSRNRKGCT
jgi:hypothetical protein